MPVARAKTKSSPATSPARRAAHLAHVPPTIKGKARRRKLKEATARLLETISYHDLTLEQITRDAGIPTSVFYHYFQSKEQLANELADEIFEEFDQIVIAARPYGTFERGIRFVNGQLLRLYSRYVGVMRCVTEVETPEFAQRWRAHIWKWRRRLGNSLAEFSSLDAPDRVELVAVAHALCAMSETFAYEYCILANPDLHKKFRTAESAADCLSALWLRALFRKEPQDPSEIALRTLTSLIDRDTGSRP